MPTIVKIITGRTPVQVYVDDVQVGTEHVVPPYTERELFLAPLRVVTMNEMHDASPTHTSSTPAA